MFVLGNNHRLLKGNNEMLEYKNSQASDRLAIFVLFKKVIESTVLER